MLTKREHKIVEMYSYLISNLKMFPLVWTKGNFTKMKHATTIWQKIGTYFQLFISFCHSAFLIVQFIPDTGYGYTSKDFNSIPFSMIIHAITLIARVTSVVMQTGAMFKAEELANLVNHLLHFNVKNGTGFYDNFQYNKRQFFVISAFFINQVKYIRNMDHLLQEIKEKKLSGSLTGISWLCA